MEITEDIEMRSDGEPHKQTADGSSKLGRVWHAAEDHVLVGLSVLGVVLGLAVGLGAHGQASDTIITLVNLLGDVYVRMLKLVGLPIVICGLINSASLSVIRHLHLCILTDMSRLSGITSVRLAANAVVFFVLTTCLAAIGGTVLVIIAHPGDSYVYGKVDRLGETSNIRISSLDLVVDVVKNLVPDNVFQACFQMTGTEYFEVEAASADISTSNTGSNYSYYDYASFQLPVLKRTTIFSNGANAIGVIAFSCAFGLALGRVGEEVTSVFKFIAMIEKCLFKLLYIIMWYSPFGIVFLVSGRMLPQSELKGQLGVLGAFIGVVVGGLGAQVVFYHLLYLAIARRNPLKLTWGVLQALLTAFGTASSFATLPMSMRCIEKKVGVDSRVSRFLLPFGTVLNMDGTTLWSAAGTIFIAQINHISLNSVQIVTVCLCSILCSCAAANVPRGGLVTMTVIFTAIGLPTDDIAILVAVDWLLDRLRTTVNVLGNCFIAGIVNQQCEMWLKRTPEDQKNKETRL